MPGERSASLCYPVVNISVTWEAVATVFSTVTKTVTTNENDDDNNNCY